jgi:hypothetical protein
MYAAYVARGKICLERQLYDEAISDFTAALKLQSEYVMGRQILACAWAQHPHMINGRARATCSCKPGSVTMIALFR